MYITGRLIPHSRIPANVWYVVESAVLGHRGESGMAITVPLPTRFEAYRQGSVNAASARVHQVSVIVRPQEGYGVTFVDFADGASVRAAQAWEMQQNG